MNVTPPDYGDTAVITGGQRLTSDAVPLLVDGAETPGLNSPAKPPQLRPFPRIRNVLADYVAFSAEKNSIHVLGSFDVSLYSDFARRCKAEKRRPPSIVAYIARCLGIVLAKTPELMAAKLGRNLLVPAEVNLVVTMEAKTGEGDLIPLLVKVGGVDRKTLPELSTELTEQARYYKRNPAATERLLKGANRLAGCAGWMRRGLYFAVRRLPGAGRHLANFYSHVCLTSTTQFTRGHGGWGMPVYPFTTSVLLGGLSKRPVVVNDEIVIRECLDITFSFDHAIVDGAPATRFAADMLEEIESGRVLAEYLHENS